MRMSITLVIVATLAAAMPASGQQPTPPPAQQPAQPPAQQPAQPPPPAQTPVQPSITAPAPPAATPRPRKPARAAHRRTRHYAGRHHAGICSIVNGWRAFPNHDPRGYFYTGRVCCCR